MIPTRPPSSPMVGMRPMVTPLADAVVAGQPAPAPVVKPPVFTAVEEAGVVKYVAKPEAPAAMEVDATPEKTDITFVTTRPSPTPSEIAAKMKAEAPSPAIMLTQLQQFITVTAKAKVQNKPAADLLESKGLVVESAGFLVITKKGIVYLADFGML